MLQPLLFWYLVFAVIYFAAFSASSDLKRFFFLSETVWLCLFAVILGSNVVLGNPLLNVNCFFILVFTACEAVVFASILLLASEGGRNESFS